MIGGWNVPRATEKECNENRYVSRMKSDLEKLLETL